MQLTLSSYRFLQLPAQKASVNWNEAAQRDQEACASDCEGRGTQHGPREARLGSVLKTAHFEAVLALSMSML